MILQPLPQALLCPEVDDATSNEIDIELLEEFDEELTREVEAILDPASGLLAPGVRLKPQERAFKYLSLIAEAYPEYEQVPDINGQLIEIRNPMAEQQRMAEAERLNLPNYRSLGRSGLLPPPQAEPWVTLWPFKKAFEAVARDYRQVYRQEIKRQGLLT